MPSCIPDSSSVLALIGLMSEVDDKKILYTWYVLNYALIFKTYSCF